MSEKKQRLQVIIGFLCVIVGVFIGICAVYRVLSPEFNLNIPMAYGGGDDTAWLSLVKSVIETGWGFEYPRSGAPFNDNSTLDFMAYIFCNFDFLIIRIISLFSKNVGVVSNLFIFVTFFLSGITMYFVLLQFDVASIWSVLGGLAYSFMPFCINRSASHQVLINTCVIPLAVLLCWWLYSDETFLSENFYKKIFWKKKNIVAIVLGVCLAGTGLAYYTFFACFSICFITLVLVISKRKKQDLIRGLKLLFFPLLGTAMASIPMIINIYERGVYELTIRNPIDSEQYGLKIINLFLPIEGNAWPWLENKINQYISLSPLVNENRTAYLGIPALIGFILCLFYVISRQRENLNEKMVFLSKLNLGYLLLGTIGGFGAIFAWMISPMIRCYNRISTYIMCVSVCAICVYLTDLTKNKYKMKRYLIITFGVIFFLFGIIEQISFRDAEGYVNTAEVYNIDKNFITSIEEQMKDGTMVYQLPYHAYPEAGPVNNMADYAQMVGVLHSNTIRWSYGYYKERKEAKAIENISVGTTEDLLSKINQAGFEALMIDARAYTEDDLDKLCESIQTETKVQPMVSENGNLIFYNLTDYMNVYTNRTVESGSYEINSNTTIKTGFSVENEFGWTCEEEARVYFKAKQSNYILTIKFGSLIPLELLGITDKKVSIYVNEKFATDIVIDAGNNGRDVILEVDKKYLKEGLNYISFNTELWTPYTYGSADKRELGICITSVNLEEE